MIHISFSNDKSHCIFTCLSLTANHNHSVTTSTDCKPQPFSYYIHNLNFQDPERSVEQMVPHIFFTEYDNGFCLALHKWYHKNSHQG